MKIAIRYVLVLLFLSSCTSSKLIPSQYVSDAFKEASLDRILIFGNTEDKELQNRFENKMAVIMQAEGIVPYKMHEVFPDVVYKEERTQTEIEQFIVNCKSKNIDKILFASRKSITVDTVLSKSLHNYMNSLEPLRMGSSSSQDLSYDKKEVVTYIIEAAVYDIATTSEDKPIATTTLKAVAPKSLDDLENKFIKAIEKLFKSR
ncbi:hypothetical protein [uncultured Dokdonia sp.]|uniref:hypothetical protein n=1 Tax=uncultured Dokdonia sp. TaxID=575653 RepID=UPI002637E1CB|nr:hypothetical protein [uncultured Dokdonia sp.]